jgi:hypothetical protein
MTNKYNKQLLEKYHKQREDALIYLGNKCNRCNSIYELEIDHIDWRKKTLSFGKDWYQSGIWWKEIYEQGQLLCRSCHKIKTKKDLSERHQKDRSKCHGTLSQYMRYKCRCKDCSKCYSKYRKNLRLKNGETKISYKDKT